MLCWPAGVRPAVGNRGRREGENNVVTDGASDKTNIDHVMYRVGLNDLVKKKVPHALHHHAWTNHNHNHHFDNND